MVEPPHPLAELSRKAAGHRTAIHRYVLGIVRDPAAAEELTQETLFRAHRKLPTLDDPDRLSGWLYRIATNLCRDRFRAASYRHRDRFSDDATHAEQGASRVEALADDAPRLDKALEQKEMSACVQGYLTELPDAYRAVIMLHDVGGLTNPEIGRMLGVSLATVKIRIHRARRKLRSVLAEACSFSTDERGVLVCERKPRQSGR